MFPYYESSLWREYNSLKMEEAKKKIQHNHKPTPQYFILLQVIHIIILLKIILSGMCFDFSCLKVCCISGTVMGQWGDFNTGGDILFLHCPHQGDGLSDETSRNSWAEPSGVFFCFISRMLVHQLRCFRVQVI